jgi:hypothetical protein
MPAAYAKFADGGKKIGSVIGLRRGNREFAVVA